MSSGTVMSLVAWQLMLAGCVPMMLQRYDEMPRSLSNIELLIPLMRSDGDATSDQRDQSDPSTAGERYLRAHLEKDMPFSNIPSSAFVLDESLSSSSHKRKRGHKHSRKLDLASLPRSVYLESDESEERDGRSELGELDERSEVGELAGHVWRACYRLVRSPAQHQHELLLLLCSELMDAAPVPPPPRPASCRACPLWPEPAERARRDFMSLGDNSYWVQNYMKAPRKRPNRPDPNQE